MSYYSLHLDTSEQQSDRGVLLKYNYNVLPGICNLERYGISLTRIFWPESITKDAENILNTIEDETPKVDGSFIINLYLTQEKNYLHFVNSGRRIRKPLINVNVSSTI